MKTFDTASVLAVEITTVTGGYRALNILTQENLDLLDASVIGGKHFFILLSGDEGRLRMAMEKLRASDLTTGMEILDHELIGGVDRKVLEALFSLSPQKLQGAVLVVETETVSACLAVSSACVRDHGLAPVEIRIRRSGMSGVYAVLTGSSEAAALAAEECRTRLRHDVRNGSVELIDQPTAALRSLFEFTD